MNHMMQCMGHVTLSTWRQGATVSSTPADNCTRPVLGQSVHGWCFVRKLCTLATLWKIPQHWTGWIGDIQSKMNLCFQSNARWHNNMLDVKQEAPKTRKHTRSWFGNSYQAPLCVLSCCPVEVFPVLSFVDRWPAIGDVQPWSCRSSQSAH